MHKMTDEQIDLALLASFHNMLEALEIAFVEWQNATQTIHEQRLTFCSDGAHVAWFSLPQQIINVLFALNAVVYESENPIPFSWIQLAHEVSTVRRTATDLVEQYKDAI